jgi:hypothetical protein
MWIDRVFAAWARASGMDRTLIICAVLLLLAATGQISGGISYSWH